MRVVRNSNSNSNSNSAGGGANSRDGSGSSTSSNTTTLTYLRPKVAELYETLSKFMEDEVIPSEHDFHNHLSQFNDEQRWTFDAIPPCLSRLQQRARQLCLWNLFIPPRLVSHLPPQYLDWYPYHRDDNCTYDSQSDKDNNNNNSSSSSSSVFLTYREYGLMAELMGRSEFGAMVCNCSAPDTGNMEVLLEFGTPEQQAQYLVPLLKCQIRSTFLMTEPNVASSDPTNLSTTLTKLSRNSYRLDGQKWWSTGAMDPRCRVGICVAKVVDLNERNTNSKVATRSKHGQHTIVIVPIPHPGVKMVRPLTVFGYDDAPFGHAEVSLQGLQLDDRHLVGGLGSGFQVSQARLGPGRIHHCMRAVGMAQRCYELMLLRSTQRQTFGKFLWEHGSLQRDIADSFADIQQARLLTLHCAYMMDEYGPKQSRQLISSIKVAVPNLASKVIDRALQVYGGAGVSNDYILASAYANMRTLRIADGPDEVHRRSVAMKEIKQMLGKQKQIKQNNSVGQVLRPPTSRL
mmetsp:Transcript_44996/g.109334  ORF Transcript_44996/g.109334 Transcript_44996/m.109334 type:complete len:516 (-) Transcript_44996:67-1614(-)